MSIVAKSQRIEELDKLMDGLENELAAANRKVLDITESLAKVRKTRAIELLPGIGWSVSEPADCPEISHHYYGSVLALKDVHGKFLVKLKLYENLSISDLQRMLSCMDELIKLKLESPPAP